MNDFQHVRSGEPIVIPASTYNAMLDAAQAHRNRKINLSPRGPSFDALYVHVENATGKFLERFCIVGLDGPNEPENSDAFCSRITFRGIVPEEEHTKRFAVLQQDAEPNRIVRACVSGVTVCKIQVEREPDSFVDLSCGATAAVTESLKLDEEGAAVLWIEPGTGLLWGIIRTGDTGGGSSMKPGRVVTAITQNPARSASGQVAVLGPGGTSTGTSVTAYAFLLNPGESLGVGRLVWMTVFNGQYEIVSANCP